jgi:hypothetical protein
MPAGTISSRCGKLKYAHVLHISPDIWHRQIVTVLMVLHCAQPHVEVDTEEPPLRTVTWIRIAPDLLVSSECGPGVTASFQAWLLPAQHKETQLQMGKMQGEGARVLPDDWCSLQVLRDMERQRLIYIVLASGDQAADKQKVQQQSVASLLVYLLCRGTGRSWLPDIGHI